MWLKDSVYTSKYAYKGYLSTELLHRNTTTKYNDIIISKLFHLKSGSVVKFKYMKNTNIMYNNNVIKVVERKKMLHEAQLAGYTRIYNDIVSLFQELRQRGYIIEYSLT